MHLRIRLALLLLLSSAAAFAGAEAWRSLRPPEDEAVPQELYAPFAARGTMAEGRRPASPWRRRRRREWCEYECV